MAYADHSQTSSRTVALVIVALIHVLLGYAFVTGLGMKYVKKAAEQLNVIDIKEPPPPEELPPPPPKPENIPPPPVVAPPPLVRTPSPPPPVVTVPNAPPPPPVIIPTPAPPPAPPAPPRVAKPASPRNSGWVDQSDYPSRALREEREGSTGFRLTIDEGGRVSNCVVTSSSGHADLDEAACNLITRRARFRPAEDANGNKISSSFSSRVVWRIER